MPEVICTVCGELGDCYSRYMGASDEAYFRCRSCGHTEYRGWYAGAFDAGTNIGECPFCEQTVGKHAAPPDDLLAIYKSPVSDRERPRPKAQKGEAFAIFCTAVGLAVGLLLVKLLINPPSMTGGTNITNNRTLLTWIIGGGIGAAIGYFIALVLEVRKGL